MNFGAILAALARGFSDLPFSTRRRPWDEVGKYPGPSHLSCHWKS